ncbi:MAG TPA: hypothetical protein VD997_01790 [Phycisphaerales bacterium]|nr:hypothetical protein [Phycisphaerales bacterium]
METPEKFVTLMELARKTGLPAAWLRREAEAGRLPSIMAGRQRMFPLAKVVEQLQGTCTKEVARGE